MDIVSDPSIGSPTETLLRLLLPLSSAVQLNIPVSVEVSAATDPNYSPTISSVEATGGVYKGQGRIQRMLMTCTY